MPETVFFQNADDDLKLSVRKFFKSIYGESRPWLKAKTVLIKPNAVNFEPHVYVEPKLIGALVAVLKEQGVKDVAVMESCTNGSFTRLVFMITGIKKAVKKAGGRCVYLDEGNSVEKEMGKAGVVHVSMFLDQTLCSNREDYFYINLAKLKTHSMTRVTLCLKNQWGFVDPKSRGGLHNDFLHQSIKEVNKIFVPDLNIVEGIVATNYGHFPLKGYEEDTLWHGGILVAGTNPVSVDAACCRFIGIDPLHVDHISMCAKDPKELDPDVNMLDSVNPPPKPFTHELHPYFPKGITVHKGNQKCCVEGCFSNPVCAVQVLGANYSGEGRFDMFLGKGHDEKVVESCMGPALVVGPCAKEEVYDTLVKNLGRKNVRLSPGHNNLKETIRHLMPLMHISVVKASPVPFYKLGWAYLMHKIAGSRADVGFF